MFELRGGARLIFEGYGLVLVATREASGGDHRWVIACTSTDRFQAVDAADVGVGEGCGDGGWALLDLASFYYAALDALKSAPAFAVASAVQEQRFGFAAGDGPAALAVELLLLYAAHRIEGLSQTVDELLE